MTMDGYLPGSEEREAYRPIAETETAADEWLAEALRKLARDQNAMRRLYAWMDRHDLMTTPRSVLMGLADVLEGSDQ